MSDGDSRTVKPRHLMTCSRCGQPAIAIEQGSIEEADDSGDFSIRVGLLECTSCHRAMVVTQVMSLGELSDPQQVWPAGPRDLSAKIPAPLRRELAEARNCYDVGAYTASVVLVRRTLEGVCAQHRINKPSLQKALQEMASQGLLDSRLLEWIDRLRTLGNDGAHYTGSTVSREDASDALALAEAVLDYLYVLAAQFEEFKQRRMRATQPGNPDSGGGDDLVPRRSAPDRHVHRGPEA